jgi:Family of unknown function (DUF5941)
MTVALVLAAEADADLRGQLAALGVRRVDAAERSGTGLLTLAAAARAAAERMLICVGDGAVPGDVLARLLGASGTAAFTGAPVRAPARRARAGNGALMVDTPDLDALAGAAESLAATRTMSNAVGALLGELARRGVSVQLLDAGPDGDGAFAHRLADPAARDIAQWAAGRDLAPAALYGISLGLGLLSALWFTELAVSAKMFAIVALAGSFLAGRAGSMLAFSGRDGWVRAVVDWIGAASGLLTEFAIYAALAYSSGLAGSEILVNGTSVAGLSGVFGDTVQNTIFATWGGPGQEGVWRLAIIAMLMIGVRRMTDLCYEATAAGPWNLFHQPVMRRVEQAIAFPAGERFAVLAATAVFFGPRMTFLLLILWGAVAAGYVLAGRIVGSARATSAAAVRQAQGGRPHGAAAADPWSGRLTAYRGDGVLSRWLGHFVQGRLPPLPPVLVGLFVTCVLAALGLANLPGVLVLTPVEAMLLAAFGSWHPHDGRLDWLVPPLLQVGEYVFLTALGFAYHVPPALIFALLAAVVLRHFDLAYRARFWMGIPADVFGLGWEGRMLLAGLATMAGLTTFAFAAISGYLWVLFGWDFLSGWLSSRDGD